MMSLGSEEILVNPRIMPAFGRKGGISSDAYGSSKKVEAMDSSQRVHAVVF
jgi:hypothetical protein